MGKSPCQVKPIKDYGLIPLHTSNTRQLSKVDSIKNYQLALTSSTQLFITYKGSIRKQINQHQNLVDLTLSQTMVKVILEVNLSPNNLNP